MNLSQNKIHMVLKLSVCFIAVAFLASCSNTKSEPNLTTAGSNAILLNGNKTLSYCNRTSNTNVTFNTGVYQNPDNGQYDYDIVKMKISSISTTLAASGNTVSFYKWRVNGTTTQLDETALKFMTYNYNDKRPTSGEMQALATSQINTTRGLYIKLNDDNFAYQIIKMVIYDSTGKVLTHVNSLIPGYYASPVDYKLNADGTARAELIQQLHPLYGTDVTGWGATQFQTALNQYCF